MSNGIQSTFDWYVTIKKMERERIEVVSADCRLQTATHHVTTEAVHREASDCREGREGKEGKERRELQILIDRDNRRTDNAANCIQRDHSDFVNFTRILKCQQSL